LTVKLIIAYKVLKYHIEALFTEEKNKTKAQ